MRTPRIPFLIPLLSFLLSLRAAEPFPAAGPVTLEGRDFRVSADPGAGGFQVEDGRSGIAWAAGPFEVRLRQGGWRRAEGLEVRSGELPGGTPAILFEGEPVSFALSLTRERRSLAITCRHAADASVEEVRLLSIKISPEIGGDGFLIVPAREGLLIPAGGAPFRRAFGTSEYEGCHLNVIGLGSSGAAAMVTWDDPYVTPEAARLADGDRRELSLEVRGRKTARAVEFTPLGKGGIDEIAAAYRGLGEEKGLRRDLRRKLAGRPGLDLLIGASNFKLWTCLERKMSEDSRSEESVEVHWTFEQAAQVAEHLKNDLGIDRCLFTLGGWTHRGYDCQHPDVLPAAPECGGNEGLARALERIRALGYADCLHDNYQDIYRDSPSYDEGLIQKRPDGTPCAGGRWLGGRAYLVCASKQLELAKRPGNLPEVKRLFAPRAYFIDTTYAVGPQECFDPAHPLTRADDIRWKSALSDYAREQFGVFGSECGREWAVPHSDFFEGLVGVGGKYYHDLNPDALGAVVIPFFEMVYHDCEIAWGKYGFDQDGADEYVLHHVACARPLHHHQIPGGLYWKRAEGDPPARGAFTRADGGWAEGLTRTDRFLKNTHEVLGPLHRATAHQVLEKIEFLAPDRSVRRLSWGGGQTVVQVNFGAAEVRVKSALGGEAALPRHGFLIESPRFAAFHGTRWGGVSYEKGALFTLSSLDGRPLSSAGRVRAFHGFGSPALSFRGKTVEVRREEVIEPDAQAGNGRR